MRHLPVLVLCTALAAENPCPAAGIEAMGNTDGVLTWRLGTLAAGESAREIVLFAYADSHAELCAVVEKARAAFAALPGAEALDFGPSASIEPPVWIANGVTDFALGWTGFFRWDLTQRQALACARGGQLSQFTYFVHFWDDEGRHRAGTPQYDASAPENLRVVEPVRALSGTEAAGLFETGDGKLRIRVRALMGEGAVAAVEFVLASRHDRPLVDVRLSLYANMEAAHTHEGDYSCLDARTAGLLVCDPPTGIHTVMTGVRPPVQGYAGTWNSFPVLAAAEGIAREEWREFAGVPAGLKARLERETAAARGIYLPYAHRNPETPPTRTLSPEESQAAIERDWLFQAMGAPRRARAAQEIGWARELAERLAQGSPAPDLVPELAELDRLAAELAAPGTAGGDGTDLYLAVRRVKRRIAFKNPVLDFARILCIDQPMPRGPVNDIHESIHRMGITATPGGRLLVLDGLHPGAAVLKLAPEKPGSFWRPDLSFDATRVLFCYKAHDAKSFHLHEVGIDGANLRELTSSDYDDIDPLYLPDGNILFTTTRGNSHVRCGPFIYSYILARCNAGGGDIYLTSYNGEPDFVPALLGDGRVIYSRWEYTDKPLWRVQSLWTTNQDGTGTIAFWGNQSVWPDHLAEPRPIPGTQRVMFAGAAHHDWFSGSIGILDPGKGNNFPHGLTKVTCDLRWPECSPPPHETPESPRYHAAGNYSGYKTPWPLSAEDFLVSARGEGDRFRLYLMDVGGNRELIYEGAHNIWHAMPVKPRRPPPRRPDLVAWPGTGERRGPVAPGTLFSVDVYEGVPDLPRGSAKYLRVWQLDYKTYSTWAKTWRNSGPPVSVVQEEGVKRILSEVPVEDDGSVHFTVPAGVSVYFQLLDAQRRCLQTMRSFTGVMPGERRGCIGCHEQQGNAPPQRYARAVRRPPTPLSPPPWGAQSISYERFAQPVLDRHCGACHQGDGKARATLDLTLRPGHDVFKEPYLTLVGSAGWGNPVPDRGQPGYGIAGAIPVESMDPSMNDPKAYATLRPMRLLSYASPLIARAMDGAHHGVKVEGEDLLRLMAWVDACCPFMGEPELRALGDPDFAGIEDLPIRPRVATAPVIERP